jgi:hypothetical protein
MLGCTMANFTPGPWRVCSKDGIVGVDVRSQSGRRVAATYGICNQARTSKAREARDKQDRANAHLIAAAPEMYEALKAIEAEHIAFGSLTPDAIRRAAAAIAKAEGSNVSA